MPLNDAAVLVPATGHYYFAPEGTARPTNAITPAGPWSDVGHTSLDSPFGLKSKGGDVTVLGTWQNAALRTQVAANVETVVLTLEQWDTTTLPLYYGSNCTIVSGRVRTPANPTPALAAMFCVVSDGEDQIAFYFPSVSVYRVDDLAFDATKIAGLPVAATVLGTSGQTWLYEIDPKGELSALVSIAVTPASPSIVHPSGTVQLVATATYTNGDTHDVTTLAAWTSATPADATVGAATGLVTGLLAGSSVITATYLTITGTTTVTVT